MLNQVFQLRLNYPKILRGILIFLTIFLLGTVIYGADLAEKKGSYSPENTQNEAKPELSNMLDEAADNSNEALSGSNYELIHKFLKRNLNGSSLVKWKQRYEKLKIEIAGLQIQVSKRDELQIINKIEKSVKLLKFGETRQLLAVYWGEEPPEITAEDQVFLGKKFLIFGLTYELEFEDNKAIAAYTAGTKYNSNNLQLLERLGTVQFRLENYAASFQAYEKGLRTAKESQNQKYEGLFNGRLGDIYKVLGKYQIAIVNYHEAIVKAKLTGDTVNEGVWLLNIGTSYNYLGDYPKTIKYCEKAMVLFTSLDDKRYIGKTLSLLGTTYDYLEEYQKAAECFQQALLVTKNNCY